MTISTLHPPFSSRLPLSYPSTRRPARPRPAPPRRSFPAARFLVARTARETRLPIFNRRTRKPVNEAEQRFPGIRGSSRDLGRASALLYRRSAASGSLFFHVV